MNNKPRSYFTFIRFLIGGIACLILIPLVTYKELGYVSIIAGAVISLIAFVISYLSYKSYKDEVSNNDNNKKE